MAPAKPVVVAVVVIAFLLAVPAAVPMPDGGGDLPPLTLLPPRPPATSLPDGGGNLPASDEVRGLGGGGGGSTVSTMAVADPVRVRRRVHHQQRDSVPCSRRGASYYNCRPGAQGNPYRRACFRIKDCHA